MQRMTQHVIVPKITKQQMLDAIASLPDDAEFEDGIEALHVLYKIERGLAEADAGLLMAKWLG
jgi:hypothetical protein